MIIDKSPPPGAMMQVNEATNTAKNAAIQVSLTCYVFFNHLTHKKKQEAFNP